MTFAAPRRARPRVPLPAFDCALVGALCLERELAFGLAHRLVGGPVAAAALPAPSAGLELEAAHLLLGQRGLREGVVLAAREQTPKQTRQLACAGDDRDRVSATRLDALIEAGDRAGLAHRRPARLNEHVTGAA